jgi:phosphoadenosine phosphosulfate reductase
MQLPKMNNTKIDQKLVDKLEKIAGPGKLMAELFRIFGNRAAIGTSGQWTGVALIDMVIRAGISNPRVYTVDTLRLFPETYDLFRELEKKYNIKIEKAPPDFDAVNKMVRDHGEMIFFDSKAKQEHCCKIRKVDPNNKILDTLDVWITGLRADQSDARSQIKRLDIIQHTQQDGKERPLLKVTPLIAWTEEQVKEYARTNNVPVHKLLEMERDGWHYASLGCIICTTPINSHETRRAGRWRWFNQQLDDDDHKECGIHIIDKKKSS